MIDGGGGYYYPICDIETCKSSCLQHLGYYIENGATCLKGECYCKETLNDIPQETTEQNKEDIIWNYDNQNGTCFIDLHL